MPIERDEEVDDGLRRGLDDGRQLEYPRRHAGHPRPAGPRADATYARSVGSHTYKYVPRIPRVPSPAAAHIGERIRVAREGVRMTHDQLAAATGIDSANIRSYESGRAMPKSC
ncbi:hypothetical protein GCM10009724_20940 [Microbacterium lacticum]|nr:hypothetical protein MLA01_20970 [Microbacterium lacticum]GGI69744.1 hypothetical protein GCM10009724_20940 [Microbacterium lacticum]